MARHGVFDHERSAGQRFLVDLDLRVDLALPGSSDRLEDTVDYGALAGVVHDVVAGERWDLIERVASRVAETVLDHDDRIREVTVTIHKPDAPIPHAFADVSVSLTRARPG